jgi:hypothetical protein
LLNPTKSNSLFYIIFLIFINLTEYFNEIFSLGIISQADIIISPFFILNSKLPSKAKLLNCKLFEIPPPTYTANTVFLVITGIDSFVL